MAILAPNANHRGRWAGAQTDEDKENAYGKCGFGGGRP